MDLPERPNPSRHDTTCFPEEVQRQRLPGVDRIAHTELFFQTLIEHVPAIVYYSPPDDPGDVRYVSPQVEDVLGVPQNVWMENRYHWKSLLHPDDYDRMMASDAESARSGEVFNERYRLRHRDGHYVWLRDQGVLVHDEHGEPRFWLPKTPCWKLRSAIARWSSRFPQ
jgi:PAS domain S-box-containing protein